VSAPSPNTCLIVGLGNPGRKYLHTRHNVGFDVVEALALAHEAEFKAHARIPAQIAEWKSSGKKWIALKPVTFMNLSGQAVATALNYFKLEISSLLLVFDDVELLPGQLRLKPGGGAGGHNGVKSVIDHLSTKDFYRLRCGIGRPPPEAENIELSDWLLRPFEKTELIWVKESINKAVRAVESWVLEGPVAAMNRFNQATEASPGKPTDTAV
jgi:peptidyl-tRNA hydrolase, PTH1 family